MVTKADLECVVNVRRRRSWFPPLLASLASLVLGCATVPPPSPSASVTPRATTRGSATSVEPSTPGSRLFGKISSIDPTASTITIDLAQIFDLPDAIEAARADGVIGPSGDLPDPFYVRDLHRHQGNLLGKTVTVTVLGHDADGNGAPLIILLAEFVRSWRTGPASGAWQPAAYYWFDTQGDTIVGIEAQVIP